MACWLLGCVDVLTAHEAASTTLHGHPTNGTWSSRWRANACTARRPTLVASTRDEAAHLGRAACSCDAPLLFGKLGGGDGDERVNIIRCLPIGSIDQSARVMTTQGNASQPLKAG